MQTLRNRYQQIKMYCPCHCTLFLKSFFLHLHDGRIWCRRNVISSQCFWNVKKFEGVTYSQTFSIIQQKRALILRSSPKNSYDRRFINIFFYFYYYLPGSRSDQCVREPSRSRRFDARNHQSLLNQKQIFSSSYNMCYCNFYYHVNHWCCCHQMLTRRGISCTDLEFSFIEKYTHLRIAVPYF